MGFYVNPKDGSAKEAWLEKHGKLTEPETVHTMNYPKDKLPVCLVDNGIFTAAGIGFDQQEREAFLRQDGRDKIWFLVAKKDLEQFLYGQKTD